MTPVQAPETQEQPLKTHRRQQSLTNLDFPDHLYSNPADAVAEAAALSQRLPFHPLPPIPEIYDPCLTQSSSGNSGLISAAPSATARTSAGTASCVPTAWTVHSATPAATAVPQVALLHDTPVYPTSPTQPQSTWSSPSAGLAGLLTPARTVAAASSATAAGTATCACRVSTGPSVRTGQTTPTGSPSPDTWREYADIASRVIEEEDLFLQRQSRSQRSTLSRTIVVLAPDQQPQQASWLPQPPPAALPRRRCLNQLWMTSLGMLILILLFFAWRLTALI